MKARKSMLILALPALLLAILLSVAISFVMGALIERFIIRRFEGGEMHTTVVVNAAETTEVSLDFPVE